MKSWPPAKIGISGGGEDGESDGCNLSCLVAIARVLVGISWHRSVMVQYSICQPLSFQPGVRIPAVLLSQLYN